MGRTEASCVCFIVSSCVGFCLFPICLYIALTQRKSSLISRRAFPLLLISLLGNGLNICLFFIEGLIYFTYHETEGMWVCFYLWLMTEYWFFAPYMFRVYHVKVSFDNKHRPKNLREQPRLSFTRYIKYMLVGFSPFLLLFLAVLCAMPAGEFPYSIEDTKDHAHLCEIDRYRIALWQGVSFLQCILWLVSMYRLRNVHSEFNIIPELLIVCGVTCFSSISQLAPYSWVFFNISLRDICIMVTSNLWPVLTNRGQKFKTVLTPEAISCFELALTDKRSLNVFLEFMRQAESEEIRNGEDLLWLVLALNTLEKQPSISTARDIYTKYIAGSVWFSTPQCESVRIGLANADASQTESIPIFPLFKACRLFALKTLKNRHFQQFLDSSLFLEFRGDVEEMNRVLGQFEATCREMQ